MNTRLVKQTTIVLSIISLVFVVLRLAGYIAWPWYWVLSPILLYAAFVLPIWIADVVTRNKE